jgi:nitrite reductase (NADH) small subunit
MKANDWQVVCRVDDIPVLGARRVARPRGMDVAVFRNDSDEVFALLDRCPHKGGPLSQGIVFGTSVACPLHNWTIGLDDGCAKAPDEGCTQRFACRVEDGRVLLDPVELATLAIDSEPPRAGPNAGGGPLGDATFGVQAPQGR